MSQADRTRWGVVALTVGAAVVLAFQVGKVPAAIPVLRAEFGLSLVVAGIVVSMFNGIASLIGVFAGALADLAGARRIIVGGVLLTGVSSLAGAFVDDGALLLVTRFFEGLGAIVVFVSGPIILIRAARPADMGQIFGLWGAYMPTGTALMIALTPVLLTEWGWRGIWIANAVLLGGMALWFHLGTRTAADPPAPPAAERIGTLRQDLGAVLGARGPWLLSLCFATYTANYLCVAAFLPTYLIERLGYASGTAALVTALAIFGNAVGNVLGGWLLKRGTARWLLIAVAAGGMGASSIGIFRPGDLTWLPVALAFAFNFIGGFLPVSVLGGTPVFAPAPRQVGTTSGLIMQFSNIGSFVGPPLLAIVVAGQDWGAGPQLTVALGAAGVGFGVWIGIEERRRRRRG